MKQWKNILTRGWVWSGLLLNSCFALAQQAATSTDVLRSALQDEVYQQQQGSEAFFNQSALGLLARLCVSLQIPLLSWRLLE